MEYKEGMELQVGVLYHTSNYKLFNIIECNRDIIRGHVIQLAAKIRVRNMLHLAPGIINGKFSLFDGQHRLGAAELLLTPYYFLFDPSVTNADIITLNSTSNTWKPEDYLKYYVKNGNEKYIKFQKFLKNYPKMKINIALFLMGKKAYKDFEASKNFRDGFLDITNYDHAGVVARNVDWIYRSFRDGQIVLEDYEHAVDVASNLNLMFQAELKVDKRMVYKDKFIYAISALIRQGNFDLEKFLKRVALQPNLVFYCETSNDYLQMLKNILNG